MNTSLSNKLISGNEALNMRLRALAPASYFLLNVHYKLNWKTYPTLRKMTNVNDENTTDRQCESIESIHWDFVY